MKLVAHDIRVELAGRTVLDGVSLDGRSGELVAIIGPNGAGKSTLLRSLGGLLKLSSGGVTLEGRNLDQWDRYALSRAIAYLPQDRSVHWPLTVRSVVALGRLPHGGSAYHLVGENRAAVERALVAMELSSLETRPVTELSGGELARVLVARALAQEAQVLLADEPTAGLDPGHQLSLFERLKGLASQGRSIFVALHDLSLAARFCDRVILLKNGRFLGVGVPEDVLTPDALAAAYGVTARLIRVDGVPLVLAASQLP
jgi:iron complex transport system ATP-binding protein